MKKTVFIKNAAILTVSSLVLRFAGIIFKVFIAALIGSEGIGLYQLIFSVYVLASTFASAGISTAVTRLVAEEIALGCKKGVTRILKRSLQITLLVAIISSLGVYFGADFIAQSFLSDNRAALALKIVPVSLPFMGVSSCLRGYFIARRRVTPNAATQLFEQAVRIIAIVLLLKNMGFSSAEDCCAAVISGDVIAEILACAVLLAVYAFDRKKLNTLSGRNHPPYGIFAKLTHIALPITSGRYLNTLLRTAENILVPKNLAKYPLSGATALSQFGMIKGMALPILFFPSAVLNAVSTLLIPEMSEASARNNMLLVRSATRNILKLTGIISFIFGAIFFVAGDKIGNLIYKEEQVGFLIKALSPIVPLMYLDSISDGILKGLDQQIFSFRTAISDSVIRIILILILLPLTGLWGFIGIMYFSNFLTCFLNVGRLIKVTGARLDAAKEVILPLISAVSVSLFAKLAVGMINNICDLVYIILLCAVSILLYLFLLKAFGTIKIEDFKSLVR